jgi:hypothetical protein
MLAVEGLLFGLAVVGWLWVLKTLLRLLLTPLVPGSSDAW